MNEVRSIPVLDINSAGISEFLSQDYPLHIRAGMILTDRVNALNLRFRESAVGYVSDWHVAGDPTLIIIQQGCLRIWLRDGASHDFKVGQAFIAKDYLPQGVEFNSTVHGHRAEVVGDEPLQAVHIKLDL